MTKVSKPKLKLPSVLSVVESVIGSTIGPEDPLMASGLDSLGAVQLRNAIAERFGVELPATAALDFPTSFALATHITSQSGAGNNLVAKADAVLTELWLDGDSESFVNSRLTEVVGVSCIHPGEASTNGVSGFWTAAVEAHDLTTTIPYARWDTERHYSVDVSGKH